MHTHNFGHIHKVFLRNRHLHNKDYDKSNYQDKHDFLFIRCKLTHPKFEHLAKGLELGCYRFLWHIRRDLYILPNVDDYFLDKGRDGLALWDKHIRNLDHD